MPLDVPDLRDDLVRLRPPALGDVDAITRECQDPEIPRYTRIMSPYGRDDAVRFVEDAGRSWAEGTSAAFVIASVDADEVLGSVGLMRIHDERLVAEIGYWVAAGARRGGIATRAVRMVATWAVRVLGIARVELMTRVENVASQGVAARAGFTREGVLRSYTTLGCGLADVAMFSLLPADVDTEPRSDSGPDPAGAEASARG